MEFSKSREAMATLSDSCHGFTPHNLPLASFDRVSLCDSEGDLTYSEVETLFQTVALTQFNSTTMDPG